jgi:hypothetical protein
MTDDYASRIDKTDWNDVIQRALERALKSYGFRSSDPDIFYRDVESAYRSIAIHFPNWDVKTKIDERVLKCKLEKDNKLRDWLKEPYNKYKYAQPWVFWEKYYEYNTPMYEQIFDILLDETGRERVLMHGKKAPRAPSSEMKDEVEQSNDESHETD